MPINPKLPYNPKFEEMHPLQATFLKTGNCIKCHTKTLVDVGVHPHFANYKDEFNVYQCNVCLAIYILPQSEGEIKNALKPNLN